MNLKMSEDQFLHCNNQDFLISLGLLCIFLQELLPMPTLQSKYQEFSSACDYNKHEITTLYIFLSMGDLHRC